MVGKRIDVVLVKLCAVIIVVMTMQSLTGFVAFYVNTPEANFVATTAFFLNFVLPMLIAVALWVFPATIIGSVSNDSNAAESGPDWALLSVTLIGLYVLVFGVIDLGYYESFRAAEQEAFDPDRLGIYSPSPETIAGRITNIIQIVIGLILLAGKRRIANLIKPGKAPE
jgi:hypothetical protein